MGSLWKSGFGTFLVAGAMLCAPVSAGIDVLTTPGDPEEEIDIDFGEYLPPSGIKTRIDDSEVDAIVLACDQLAAHPGNEDNPEGIEGIAYAKMSGYEALPACLKAVEVAPELKRMRYQLARAKQASGQGRDAVDDLTVLADESYVPAINNLGATYQLGIGVPKDYEKAVKWYEIAAAKGFVPSMAILGWMHHSGLGTPKDDEEAIRWYRKAAAGGSASAMYNMGFMRHNGWGIERDAVKAADWFRRSAESGFGQAMSMTAWTYQVGRGVSVDGSQAIEWYTKAAEIGELSAMDSLGGFYDTGGSGIARQPKKAAEWLIKSLEAGNPNTRKRLVENPEALQVNTRREIQILLDEKGYSPGAADGVFGKKTRDAVDRLFTAP